MFAEIIVSSIVGLLSVWYIIFWQSNRHIRRIPSPRVWPIIGSALEFSGPSGLLDNLKRLHQQHKSKTLRIQLGFRSSLQTYDYKLLEFLLASNVIISKGAAYRFLHEWLGLGLLTSDGEKWRTHRKMITPTFHFKILEQFIDIFNANATIMTNKMQKDVGNKSVDIFPYVTLCTLDIICETAMGACVKAQSKAESLYTKCVKDMGRITEIRTLNPLYHNNFIYQFSQLARTEKFALKVLHDYTNSVISQRRRLLKTTTTDALSNSATDDIGQKKRTAFLDMLLLATINGVPLTDQEIREEVDTFMFEGHDTTAAGISFALFVLAHHPEVQTRAFEELRNIFGDDTDRESTYQDLQDMKYLEMVVKESLRLYPPVPLIGRRITTDNVEYDGMILSNGLNIGISIYSILRDPDYYDNPEEFNPNRFDILNNDGKLPFAYIPFSAGPRNCIGQKFAMLELKAIISKVLRQFELRPASPVHNLKLSAETVLKSLNGMKVALNKRTY